MNMWCVFRRSFDDPYTADPTFWEEIITFEMPRRGHNGGNIHFGTDGYLYLSVGDGGSTGSGASGGGSGGDADNNGQRLDVTLGKILRLDVSGPAPYTIPADNPFVPQFGARGEIWAYGLRNPWRWSFDRLTGDMYVGDVGEVDWEEINFTPAGVAGTNYGWRLLEGPDCYEPVIDCDPTTSPMSPFSLIATIKICAASSAVSSTGAMKSLPSTGTICTLTLADLPTRNFGRSPKPTRVGCQSP